jgi:hypothetical protein
MHKFKKGNLHSGSKSGPPVNDRKQAIAIMLSEKRKADSGDSEYKPIGPSVESKKKMFGKKGKK